MTVTACRFQWSIVAVSAQGYPAQDKSADAEGAAHFAGLAAGEYSVAISHPCG
jgi:hypothetical protein